MREIKFVDLKKQYDSIQEEIDWVIQDVIHKSVFYKGEYVEKFEQEWRKAHNRDYCIGVANATDGLFLTLKALGIGEYDTVIVPTNTFIATAEAVNHTGAVPTFVDCDPMSYNIDVDKIEDAVTGNTKAIIPVHMYGQLCDMKAISEIASKYGLAVIEDCAHAHFAEDKDGHKAGTFGVAGVHSFYPGKILGAYGDAGAVITDDRKLAMQIRLLANHGTVAKFDHNLIGYSSRLDGLQAGVLSVKLGHLSDWIRKRSASASYYNHLLGTEVACPEIMEPEAVLSHVFHLYVVRVSDIYRYRIKMELSKRGIQTGIHYPKALHNAVPYKGLSNYYDFPIANSYQNSILSLPIYPEISSQDIEYVADNLIELVKEFPV